jgi:hypothetical protein
MYTLRSVYTGTKFYFDITYDRQRRSGAAPDRRTLPLYLVKSDLRCLVRTAYVLLFKVNPSYTKCGSDEEVHAFWQQALESGMCARAMAAVEGMTAVGQKGVYKELRRLLTAML